MMSLILPFILVFMCGATVALCIAVGALKQEVDALADRLRKLEPCWPGPSVKSSLIDRVESIDHSEWERGHSG
jgi:hypothetical protein